MENQPNTSLFGRSDSKNVAGKKTVKMDLLASYGDDGEKSESPGPSSDVGEKDASPVARVPSFTPYLQAEWESFEKLIAGGGESQNELTPNVEMVQPIPPDNEFSDGSNPSEEIGKRELEDSSNPMGVKSHLHNQSPFYGYSSNSSSHSSSSSRSSSLERSRDSKKINEEIINVPSRSPSRSIEHRSSSNSPIAITEESPNRHSGSYSPVHSSPSRSQSKSRYSCEPLPDHRRGEKSRSRSHSRSRSRSHRRSRSRSRGSRQRRKKYSHRSRSRSRSRKHRRSRSPHKKSKHRRRSRSRDRHRSRERGRSRSRDRFGRNMRSRDSYRDRSPTSSRRRSRSSERSRDRESYRNSRDYGRRDSRDGGSSRNKKKPLNYKEQMRQELTKASKMLSESNIGNLTELIEEKKILEPSSDQPSNAVLSNLVAATQNATVTPQVALLQTMAAMHKKAQEITGIAVPKYYNPAAVNPLKYAEQVQKRKLLWSRTPKEKKEGGPENQWQGTHFSTDQDGKMAAKFRKLMGMKSGEQEDTERVGEERKKKQEELFSRLDKEYEFARMATHTHRGVGLGFQSQNLYQN